MHQQCQQIYVKSTSFALNYGTYVTIVGKSGMEFSLVDFDKITKCDWILENRSKSHIWYFEKYQFQYSRHCISLVLDCSHARLAPIVD